MTGAIPESGATVSDADHTESHHKPGGLKDKLHHIGEKVSLAGWILTASPR